MLQVFCTCYILIKSHLLECSWLRTKGFHWKLITFFFNYLPINIYIGIKQKFVFNFFFHENVECSICVLDYNWYTSIVYIVSCAIVSVSKSTSKLCNQYKMQMTAWSVLKSELNWYLQLTILCNASFSRVMFD